MKRATLSRARIVGAILLVGALMVTAALTAISRAGSVRTHAGITISPHVLTAGQQGFLTIKFFNDGPSTVNHVVATASAVFKDDAGNTTSGALPLPKNAFDGYSNPSDCTVSDATPGTSSSITCNIGQVAPGIERRVLSFTAPAGVTPFFPHVSVTFDEGKNNGLIDTVTGDDPFPFSISSVDSRKGQCTANGDTLTPLTASDPSQQTLMVYHGFNPALFPWIPCTPASAGVQVRTDKIKPTNVTNPFGEISFVDFLDGAGLATVKVYFFSGIPKGVTKKNLALYELARFPIDLMATTANGSAAIPTCVTVNGVQQIPSGSPFHSCLVNVDTLPGGGLVATLMALGGSDGGWGGIG